MQYYTGWPPKKLATIKNHHYVVLKTASDANFFINFKHKMSTKILCIYIKYSMCDLICDVTSFCV